MILQDQAPDNNLTTAACSFLCGSRFALLMWIALIGSAQAKSARDALIDQPIDRASFQYTTSQYAKNPDLRVLFNSMVKCALSKSDTINVEGAGNRTYSISGILGLAPDWLEIPLNLQQQKWVSACAIAQLSWLGTDIPVSLRAPAAPSLIPLKADVRETALFRLYEGAYWGNLFAEEQTAFACYGRKRLGVANLKVLKARLCSLPSTTILTPNGTSQISACGLVIIGPCEGLIKRDALDPQTIHVYLNPDQIDE